MNCICGHPEGRHLHTNLGHVMRCYDCVCLAYERATPVPEPQDLYREAVTTGIEHYLQNSKAGHETGANLFIVLKPLGKEPVLGSEGVGYWIARHAARQATDALLEEAKRIGVTKEQWEALRAKAADVAYD